MINQIRNDHSLKVIIEYTLGIGNYLNGQSARGGAYGFKFDTIEKISEVKSQDSKVNLL